MDPHKHVPQVNALWEKQEGSAMYDKSQGSAVSYGPSIGGNRGSLPPPCMNDLGTSCLVSIHAIHATTPNSASGFNFNLSHDSLPPTPN